MKGKVSSIDGGISVVGVEVINFSAAQSPIDSLQALSVCAVFDE